MNKRKLCFDKEAVKKFTYLGDRVSADRGCEVAVSNRTRYGWLRLGNVASCYMERNFL